MTFITYDSHTKHEEFVADKNPAGVWNFCADCLGSYFGDEYDGMDSEDADEVAKSFGNHYGGFEVRDIQDLTLPQDAYERISNNASHSIIMDLKEYPLVGNSYDEADLEGVTKAAIEEYVLTHYFSSMVYNLKQKDLDLLIESTRKKVEAAGYHRWGAGSRYLINSRVYVVDGKII